MKSLRLKVNMTCATCATKIDSRLAKLGVISKSNSALKIVKIQYDEDKYSKEQIESEINKLGYSVIKS